MDNKKTGAKMERWRKRMTKRQRGRLGFIVKREGNEKEDGKLMRTGEKVEVAETVEVVVMVKESNSE